MAIDEELFEFDDEELSNPTDIKVIGVGGGGNNAVSRMMEANVKGVQFIAVNTDAQDLKESRADVKLQIGQKVTGGLGSGAKPGVGLKSAQESRDQVKDAVEGADLLFITAGMGGGTGTGAAPVIAEIAKEDLDILTIGVVTRPFECEGTTRRRNARAGIKQLRNNVDTLIVVPNERLFEIIEDNTSVREAFRIADEVLLQGVHGISELIVEDAEVNLDFADVHTVMNEQGDALMGFGEAQGEDAAVKAAQRALDCPLLETNDIKGAEGIIVNIAGGPGLPIRDVRDAINLVRDKASLQDKDENVFWGQAIRESLEDRVLVTVIATGFPAGEEEAESTKRRKVVDVQNLSEKEIDRPAYERKQQGKTVEVVEEDPEQVESSPPDDDEDLSIPAFMRVK